MKKTHILQEIKRTAEANGGVALGMGRFRAETGIDKSQWGKYWRVFGDAVREAGLLPNQFGSKPYDERQLLENYGQLVRELGWLPTKDDLRLKRRNDSTFPSPAAFQRRGNKSVLVAKLLEYCRSQEGWDDVIRLCEEYVPRNRKVSEQTGRDEEEIGFVYLIKSGRFYKIGKTNAAGRREYELAIQLPEKVKTIHVIPTDDPGGIEEYWHKRFAAKRKRGEWFELSAADVAAFKQRKFM